MNKSHSAGNKRSWGGGGNCARLKKKKKKGMSKKANMKTVVEAMALGGHEWLCG